MRFGPPPQPVERVGVLHVEATDPIERLTEIDFGAADEWQVLLTLRGVPVKLFRLPGPGPCDGSTLLSEAVLRHADDARARADLADAVRRRMGVAEPEHAPLTTTVVVCTRRRPEALERLLRAVRRLDPAPDELLVVDNAPGDQDCRHIAAAAGARYLRVDPAGLNRARAAAAEASRTDLVAFIDDDCEPSPAWLSELPRLFADPNVWVVTGPGFPRNLDTLGARRFESAVSFNRGLEPRVFDWLTFSPVHATSTGAGLNMIWRRSAFDRLPGLFPPELDAGTPTRSGGDSYAFYRALAAGARIAYDPSTFVFHHHRISIPEFREAVRGYGTGLGALAAKVLVDHREPSGVRVLWWIATNYVRSVARPLIGGAGPWDADVAADYVRGALAAPAAWARARRSAPAPLGALPQPEMPEPIDARPTAHARAEHPEVSVVIPTGGRSAALARCLRALDSQVEGSPAFEVVVVDGLGAAAARNAGVRRARAALLLFLDDDMVPGADLVRRHVEAHHDAEAEMVVGYCPPRPEVPSLVGRSASLWWEDHFRQMARAAEPTFVHVLSGNLSIRRDTFEALGGYDEAFGRARREDWDFGLRALEAGIRVAYEPGAVAEHRFRLDPRARIEAVESEGRGDAMLLARYPEALPSLPLARHRPLGGSLDRVAVIVFRSRRARAGALACLDIAERLGARRSWARWFALVQRAAYEQGLREGGARPRQAAAAVDVMPVALDSEDPIALPPGGAAPVVGVTVGGVTTRLVKPREGHWGRDVATDVSRKVPRDALRAVFPPRSAGPADSPDVTVLDRGEGGVSGWSDVDEAIRSAPTPVVALPLAGGRFQGSWAAPAAACLSGARTAVAFGGAAGSLTPAWLLDRKESPSPYEPIGSPMRYLAIRRDFYEALGGFDPRLAALGRDAPALELVERALAAGLLVCYRDLPGVTPSDAVGRPAREWRRWQARGALMVSDTRLGRLSPGALVRDGFGPLIDRLQMASRGLTGWRGALGCSLAFGVGCLRGAAHPAAGRRLRPPEALWPGALSPPPSAVNGRHPTPPAESPPWWSSSASIPAPPTPASEWSSHAAARSRRSTAG